MRSKDLLIEIGTEELPPGALKPLAIALSEEIHAGLEKNRLVYKTSSWYATPRRLAVLVEALHLQQDEQEITRRGPALAAAYDKEGRPSQAAQGFARACGVAVAELTREETDAGGWLAFKTTRKGRTTKALLPGIIASALARLPIPKAMRWADGEVQFVRPVHWSVVMLGEEVVPCELLGTRAGNESRGHRFHFPAALTIPSPAAYLKTLKDQAYVIADFAERQDMIRRMVEAAGEKLGGKAHIEDALLAEVSALVEWPAVIRGSFEERFLKLPKEVLISSMQDQQKYFAVTDASGERLLNHFITVANIQSKAADEIRRGNEKVIGARLSDAEFFWQRDCRKALIDFGRGLDDVIFQRQLGSLADKTARLKELSAALAKVLNADASLAVRAATLAKCDLLSEMVGEFPQLQGLMGRYYAAASGEAAEVAQALDEQYMPRQAGASLPQTDTGRILAIAEKLDTLVGIFAIGQAPSGEKDPFALRRAALGCLRIMIEAALDLDLKICLRLAAAAFPAQIKAQQVLDALLNFMLERLRRYYLDQGIRPDVFAAVLAGAPTRPYDFHQRIQAVTRFSALSEAAGLAAANKRIANLLRKADTNINEHIDAALLQEEAERTLSELLQETGGTVQALLDEGDYTRALLALAGLRDAVDAFFDQVLVMTEDERLRHNRLAILQQLNRLFLSIADISRLQH